MLNKSEIAILTIAVSIGSQNYFKMKQCRHFMQITYSPNNVLITMSCRLRGGCERLPVKLAGTTEAVAIARELRRAKFKTVIGEIRCTRSPPPQHRLRP